MSEKELMYFIPTENEANKLKTGRATCFKNIGDGLTFTIDNQGEDITSIYMKLNGSAICVYGPNCDRTFSLPGSLHLYLLTKK